MSESEPIVDLRPALAGRSASNITQKNASPPNSGPRETTAITVFNRQELNQIFQVYGRQVASGEWRDYAIDMGRETAVFSIFRRSSECPIYRIEKTPRMARRQGMYAVIAATGLILKRGADLRRVLAVIDKSLRLVSR
ncbi:MAG: DUF2794 domain-containing protein [Hyphomicrobiaceae bacterium]|nr:DUF2794 domain-containing protein [Hyphomicrobiaceae bacterium]